MAHFNMMSPPDLEKPQLRKTTIDNADQFTPMVNDAGSLTSRKTQFKLQKVLEAYNRQKELRAASKLSQLQEIDNA